MPLLYYRTHGGLYTPKGPVQSTVFDAFKIKSLAPAHGRKDIANFWHIKKHSAFSWHDDDGQEHTVFIPGLLTWREALIIAREEFKARMPSAIVFRLNNYGGAYVYD